MMNDITAIFAFLRYLLGYKENISNVVARMDWQELYSFASKQAILGLCFNGIERLGKEYPEELKRNPIGRELLMTWMGVSQQIRRQNMKVNAVAGKLFSMLRKDGLRCCILKGQGNALMYPKPYSRTPGDIDVWIDASRERIMEYAQKKFELEDDIRLQHLETSLDGVPVELHFFPCSMNNPIYNARLQKWFKRNTDLQCSNVVSLPDGIGEIAIPTTAFNVVYQLTHLYHHFFDEGIGMRQIIDYYYVVCDFYKVYQNSSKITPSLFTIKEGSTSHPDPLTLRGEGGNRPTRCSEPLRSKDGGPSKVSPDCAGWDRLTDTCLRAGDDLGATCLRAADGVGDRLGATCSRVADGLADGVGDRLGATCLRAADGLAPIQVLVNVDIFSEGFDCPDVEFVQLARPTLSLAKYLQMVGRGLRIAKGKKNCVIIDNVGLYRVFGLPSQVWNWNAMFEGKLKVGKRKETPKDREFFLMNEKQDDIQIHPDSEMMMVMSHEELLQRIQYREFVDSKGEFAIIKLPDGKMTVVNRQGEQVLEPGDYYDMKLLDGNILFYRPRRKAKCYYDLLAKAVIDDGTNVAETPHVVNIKGWEFIEYNDIFMSRTQEDFSLPYHPSQYDFLNYGYYMIFRFRPSAPGCQVWYYCEGDEGKMRMSNEESRNVCFLRNDYEHVYWLCAVLYGERIVVMDSKEDYYLVDSNLKKTYIGCNHPKNENEDLNVVMPRLGQKYYHEAMLQKKEMEANEMLLLHEKSEAGHVELYQAGKKWGVKVDGKVIVPPLYCSIAQPVGAYCAFEEIPRHWGVMTLKGKVIVDAKYEKVEIRDNGIAVVTGITGKTQTIKLLKVKE